MPFGINSIAEVLEKRVEEMFCDLQVAIYFDDLVVFGQDQEEHDRNLRKLLERANKYNVKFNKDKMQLNQNEVKYDRPHCILSRSLPRSRKSKSYKQYAQSYKQ